MKIAELCSAVCAMVVSQAVLAAQTTPTFDILIKNGRVVDGTGSP